MVRITRPFKAFRSFSLDGIKRKFPSRYPDCAFRMFQTITKFVFLVSDNLNPIAYGILRLSQLRRGGGFLSHTPENNVKIIWLVWNLVHIINGIRLLRMRNFRKFAVLFLEIWRHKIRLFTRERFIAFRCLPPELVFNDAKITFLLSKMIFLT